MIKVKVKSVHESKLEELTQDQFNKWDSARQQKWLDDHPNSKFKPQGQTKQDIASQYDASNDEDGTKWTGMNSQYKDKLVKDYEKVPDKDYEEPDNSEETIKKFKDKVDNNNDNKLYIDDLTKEEISELSNLIQLDTILDTMKNYFDEDSKEFKYVKMSKDDYEKAKKGNEIRDKIKNKAKSDPEFREWIENSAEYEHVKQLDSLWQRYSPLRDQTKAEYYLDKLLPALKDFNKKLSKKLGIKVPDSFLARDYSPMMYDSYKKSYINNCLDYLIGDTRWKDWRAAEKIYKKFKI